MIVLMLSLLIVLCVLYTTNLYKLLVVVDYLCACPVTVTHEHNLLHLLYLSICHPTSLHDTELINILR